MTFEDWTALVAAHDEKHLAKLERAFRGTRCPRTAGRGASP
jgi:hypothetical protein